LGGTSKSECRLGKERDGPSSTQAVRGVDEKRRVLRKSNADPAVPNGKVQRLIQVAAHCAAQQRKFPRQFTLEYRVPAEQKINADGTLRA